MLLEALSRRAWFVAVGAFALTFLFAYGLAVAHVGYALAPMALHEAFARGSFLGMPFGHFARRFLICAMFAGSIAVLAIASDRRALGAWSETTWRRLLLALGPLMLAPASLAQDELLRRPAFMALAVGTSVAVVARLRREEEASTPTSETPRGWRVDVPMLVVMVLHASLFTWLAVTRDRALWSATVDLGIFKEALWHTLHGRLMYSPAVGYSFFGEHYAPVLLLLVPLYALWPTSACLLSVQTLAITASSWPLYRLALERGLSRPLATVLCTALLFSPPMHTALLYDFHMDLLAVPGLTSLAWALHRQRWGWSLAALALVASVKEDMFIPACGVLFAHVIDADRRAARRAGVLMIAVVAYALLAMFVLLKRYGPPPGVSVYMADPNAPTGGYKFLRNFRHLVGVGGPLRMLLGQPVRFALYAFTEARLTTFLGFVMPLLLLPLAAGRRVVYLAPLGIILLSDNPEIVALRYHYSAVQHPGVFLAALCGAARLIERSASPRSIDRALTAGLLASLAISLSLHPASVVARVHTVDRHEVTAHTRLVERLVAQVPRDAKVSATTFLGPRFSNRPYTHFFPNAVGQVQWAVVDLQRPPWPLENGVRDQVVRGLLRGTWSVVDYADGAVLMRNGGDRARNTAAIRDLFARRRYEVEGTEWTEFTNCIEHDPTASDGRARVVRIDDPRAAPFVVFGPFIHLPPARYQVTFRLRAEATIHRGEPIGAVDVFARGVVIAARDLEATMFEGPTWRDITLDFALERYTEEIEFRVRTTRRWLLGADVISLSTPDEELVVADMLVR